MTTWLENSAFHHSNIEEERKKEELEGPLLEIMEPWLFGKWDLCHFDDELNCETLRNIIKYYSTKKRLQDLVPCLSIAWYTK